MINLHSYIEKVRTLNPIKKTGRVSNVIGLLIESYGPKVSIGELCYIEDTRGRKIISEVVGFRDNRVLLMPFDDMEGIAPGAQVISMGSSMSLDISEHYLGRVIDGLGRPLDGKPLLKKGKSYSIYREAFHPLRRRRVDEPIATGIKSIDGCITIGKGQRIGTVSYTHLTLPTKA